MVVAAEMRKSRKQRDKLARLHLEQERQAMYVHQQQQQAFLTMMSRVVGVGADQLRLPELHPPSPINIDSSSSSSSSSSPIISTVRRASKPASPASQNVDAEGDSFAGDDAGEGVEDDL